MKKIIVSLVLCLIVLLAVGICASAETRTSGPYTYKIKEDGTIAITDYDWEKNTGYVDIPTMIDGYTVTEIGDYAFTKYKEIDLYDPIILYYDYHKVPITIPDSITAIGDFAFAHTGITSINIHSNVTNIGVGCFLDCTQCTFKVSKDSQYYAVIDGFLYSKMNKELIAATNRSNDDKVTIPEGIVSIGDYSFYMCQFVEGRTNLLGVERSNLRLIIPSSVVSIGNHAFEGANLQVTIPATVTSIGDYAFYRTTIYIPANQHGLPVESKGSAMHNLRFPIYAADLGRGSFQFMRFEYGKAANWSIHANILIPEESTISTIPEYCFYSTNGGVALYIQTDTIKRVEDYGFGADYVDISADIAAQIEYLGAYAFRELSCAKNHFELNPSINIIKEGSGYLTYIPDTILEIDSDCGIDAKDLYLPPSIEHIAKDAFPRGSTFVVERDSYAERWASENDFSYSINGEDPLDWLNN